MDTTEVETVTDAASNAPLNKYTVIGFVAGVIAVGTTVAVIKWRKSRSESPQMVETVVESPAYVPGQSKKNS